MLGYVTVSLILLIIKTFGATSAEIVKSMRKVCQVRQPARHAQGGGERVTWASYLHARRTGLRTVPVGLGNDRPVTRAHCNPNARCRDTACA